MRHLFATAVLLGLTLSAPASAAPSTDKPASDTSDSSQKGPAYNGAFFEPSVRGAFVVGPDWRGWAVDAGIRHAFPLSLGDLRLSYRFDRLKPKDDAGSTAQAIGSLQTHGVRAHLAIHPLYLFMFWSDGFGYLASSFFVEVGLGVDVHTFETAGADRSRNTRFGWSVGAGFDVPLMDPDRGSAPWLNFVYRFSRRSVNPGTLGQTQPLKTHTLFAGFAWRFNGVIF
jgi:opacity protein-like surface antigen